MQPHQSNAMARNGVRMPRACKRTSPYYPPQQSLRQTRSTRAGSQEVLQQQNTVYTAAGIPEYVPCTMPESSALSAITETRTEPTPPMKFRDDGTQTDIEINEKELKFLKKLRDDKINARKVCTIIEKSEYIVTFEDRCQSGVSAEAMEPANDNPGALMPFNALQERNDMITFDYIDELERRLKLALSSENALPAIEYRPTRPERPRNTSPVSVHDSDGSESEQQEEDTVNNNCEHSRPIQEQVPPVGLPIPNIMDQCNFNNHINYDQRNHNYFGHFPYPGPEHLFHAAALFGYVRHMHAQTHQHRSNEYNRPDNVFTQCPPWC